MTLHLDLIGCDTFLQSGVNRKRFVFALEKLVGINGGSHFSKGQTEGMVYNNGIINVGFFGNIIQLDMVVEFNFPEIEIVQFAADYWEAEGAIVTDIDRTGYFNGD